MASAATSRAHPSSSGSARSASLVIGMPQTPPPERLAPMPDYLRPVTRSASRKFSKLHEDHMMGKLMEKRATKKLKNQEVKRDAKALARKIPIEVLAKEWLSETQATVEMRAYLVDKLLPTLILGTEKLLIEVNKKGLADKTEVDPNFNPINYLAQYLMRNNPRFSNFSEASPYIRGMREVTEQLKYQLFDSEENRLAKIKADAKRKREEREHEEHLQQMEKKQRFDLLHRQYSEWNAGIYPDGRVELALVQNALRSFAEVTEQYPEELRQAAQFSHELQPTDGTGKTMAVREFVSYLKQYIEDLPREVFDQFMIHLSRCALSYRSQAERQQRKGVLSQLFSSCDHTGVGLLDRHRVLDLYEMFYDKAQEDNKQIMRDPRRWPVVEVHEEASDSEDEDDSNKKKARKNTSEDEKKVTDEQSADEENKEQGDKSEEVDSEKLQSSSGDVVDQEDSSGTKDTTLQDEEEKNEEDEEKQSEKGSDEAAAADEDETEKKSTSEEEVIPQKVENIPEVEKSAEEDKAEDSSNITQEEAVGTNIDEDPVDIKINKLPGLRASKRRRKNAELAELQALPGTAGDMKPPMTQQSKVSFAEGTTFQRERTLLTSQGTRSQSQASAFDENTLNTSQFVQLTETFLGDIPDMKIFQHLVRYVREGYVETEEERMRRLLKAREEAQSARRKALLNTLFEMWDNDGSGFIDMDEVETVMVKYKDGMENSAITKAQKDHKRQSRYHDNRLSKREFRDFVYKCASYMAGGDAFDYFVEFLINSVERSYTERIRGEARKKWLQQIVKAAETSGALMEPVYKALFQTLYKDAEAHGGGKMISANISMLERNDVAPTRGDFLLRYTSTTTDDAPFLLNKLLHKDMRGISFASVESGKPIHVPRVNNHGNIHFWNQERTHEDPDGSFIVIPLKDQNKRVFGLLGVDTLKDGQGRSIFITHEIQFYQGVAKAFSIAYHHVDVRQKTMRISESAISWIHRRCPHVTEIIVYMVEPDQKQQDYILRKMMTTDEKGNAESLKNPPHLERKDNLFRDYLFKCVDNSESVTADAYGQRHLSIPLRDDEGRAIVAIDISIGELKNLPKLESREVMRILRLLQMAYREISIESRGGEPSTLLDGDGTGDAGSIEILFDRLMLVELRENVAKLDAQAYAELKSYKEPPAIVHLILKSVLAVFYTEKALADEFENWDNCKKYMNPQLSQMILKIDPTSGDHPKVPIELINRYLDDVPHGTVSKHSSIPAQFLYNWVFVCVSLLEHNRKMKANKHQQLLSDATQSSMEPSKPLPPKKAETQQQEIADEEEQAEQNDKIPDQDQITSDPSNPDAESATQEQQSNVDQEQQQA